MSRSFNGSNQYCFCNISFTGSATWSLSAWAKVPDTTGDYTACQLGQNTGGANEAALNFRGDIANDPVIFYVSLDPYGYGGASSAGASPASYSASTWIHMGGTIHSATDRRIRLNGGTEGTSSANLPGTWTFPQMMTGCWYQGGVRSSYMNGPVMHVAAWDAVLTADEWTSLAKGFSPRRIRPQSLKYYDPCIGSFKSLLSGASSFTDSSGGVVDQYRSYGF